MAIDLGDVYPLTVETRDSAGALADAGLVVLSILLPDDSIVTPTVTHSGTGRYQVDYPTVQAGLHGVNWTATGANTSAYADTFDVRARYPRYLISLAATKTKLRITGADSDEELRGYIEAATEVIERHTASAVLRRTEVEYHRICRGEFLILHRTPIISLTDVRRVDGTMVWSVSDLHVDPKSGVVTPIFGNWLWGYLQATYVPGRIVIPANFLTATEMIVQHLWETKRPVRGGLRPGGMEDTTIVPGMGFAVPNRALELLGKPPPGVW